ncbi:hypothetical protein [Catellatospora chokoriensis]|uniref:ATP-grasp domain-containing protein n=1 Tax=Catellatospora chokoriensis TaxID=310353 RepID=A0A8J3NRD2_9ACTN|nr:hypothetical protein [Catellatospora chokoriensis]GIF89830.1 hypothetical protein Cch02nite_32740 [Catellatospora chokoriensis]
MTVLVLSNQTPTIEDQLTARGQDVIVCLTAPNAAARLAARPPYEVISISSWTSHAELAQIAKRLRGRVRQVATVWEGALIAAGTLRELMDLPGQTEGNALGFVDKSIMKDELYAAGVDVASHEVAYSAADVPAAAARVGGFPVVVKPVRGFGSTNTHVVRSLEHLAHLERQGVFTADLPTSPFFRAEPAFRGLAAQGGFMVEQYIHILDEFHVDAYWIDGEPVYQAPMVYTVPALHGIGGVLGSVLIDQEPEAGPVLALAEKACRALRASTCFTHTEIYLARDGQWLVGEVAARPGGGGIQTTLAHAYGIDVASLLADLAQGTPTRPQITRADGVYGWAGPYVPPGTVTRIATRDQIMALPGVIDARVVTRVGDAGGPTGSGQWGGLAGYVWMRGDDTRKVLNALPAATDAFDIDIAADDGDEA